MATPCPRSPGCKCAYCYGLYEWASENLTSTWGLQPTPRTIYRVIEPEPVSMPVRGCDAALNPWVPRPSRHERYRRAA